eukprot:CAMPEP_0174732088 /NCGR_PEP_ID=MMETSP1094-20130205/58767_1 /TAXON_ID=156173 /ORGANISM="Chrysochromulina brevifilum, Strain UTEX LB 985" /LENGTH=143 /DNA_ID=CAMNT_0015934559 /DNA_START=12 /DNA_END=443 /DNA_ORIENTATION=+
MTIKKLGLLLSLLAAPAGALLPSAGSLLPLRRLRGGAPPAMSFSQAIAIVVDAEIQPDRVDEFLEVMEADVKGSRDEPGCLRFDVVRVSETRFFFYEAYSSPEMVDVHKAQPHFKLWSDFKASGGCVSSVSTKGGFPEWGFQA